MAHASTATAAGTKRSRDTGRDSACGRDGAGSSIAWYDKAVAVERPRRLAGIPLHGPGLSDYMGQLSQVVRSCNCFRLSGLGAAGQDDRCVRVRARLTLRN